MNHHLPNSLLRGRAVQSALVLLALVVAAVSCDNQAPLGSGGQRTIGHPLSTTSAWPDEPTGYALVSDYPFNDVIPSTTGSNATALSGGWYVNFNTSGDVSQVTTRTEAPASPPNVGQWLYPTGYVGGGAPGNLFLDTDNQKQVFYGVWWRPDSVWQDPSNGSNAIISIGTQGGGGVTLQMTSTGTTPPHRLDVMTQFEGIDAARLTPNVSTTDVTLGGWHQVEWLLKYSTTTTSADGVIEWWMDGVLQGSYTNLDMPADSGFNEYRINPEYGSSSDTVRSAQKFMYDQVHISKAGWPNEPVGFTVYSDYAFNDVIPVTTGQSPIALSNGWSIIYNDTGYATQVTNMTGAPFSPPNVGQWLYPAGFHSGVAPATLFNGSSDKFKEVYFGMWWKPSSNWVAEQSGTSKMMFIQPCCSDGDVYIEMHKTGTTPPYLMYVNTEFPSGSIQWHPNQTATGVTLGAWHQVEMYLKYNTNPTSKDGIIRWWLDGVLQADIDTVTFPADSGFQTFDLSPTWGGVGTDSVPANQYFWYDHLHASHK